MTTRKIPIYLVLFMALFFLNSDLTAQLGVPAETLSASPGAGIDASCETFTVSPSVSGTHGADYRIGQLEITITGTFGGDIDVTLTSPGGVAIDVTSDNGGTDDDVYDGTTFRDDAMVSIVDADVPFTDTYLPEEPFSTLDGEEMSGDWELEICDDFSLDPHVVESFTLVIEEFLPPTDALACPPDTVELPIVGNTCEATISYPALFPTIPADELTITVNSGPEEGSGVVQGEFLAANFTATDASGGGINCDVVFTAVDITPPTLECPGDIEVEIAPCDTWSPSDPSVLAPPVAFDNCGAALSYILVDRGTGEVISSGAGTDIDSLPVGMYDVTYILSEVGDPDSNGIRSSSCSFMIDVDAAGPILTCPDDVDVDATDCEWVSDDAIFLEELDSSCDFDLQWAAINPDGDTIAMGDGQEASATFPIGTSQVCYTALSADVTGGDLMTSSGFTGDFDPGNWTEVNNGGTVTWSTNELVLESAADEGVAVSIAMPSDGMLAFDVDYILESDIIADVFIVDIDGDVVLELDFDDEPDDTYTGSESVMETVAAGAQLVFDLQGDDFQTGGVTSVITISSFSFTTMGAGEAASCCFDVVVNDSDAPMFTCSDDVVFDDLGADGVEDCGHTMGSTGLDPVASDECGSVTITHDYSPDFSESDTTLEGAFFPLGETEITWTITDESGNSETCSFVVTVENTTPPEINCPGDQTVSLDPGLCEFIYNFEVTATDPCQTVSGSATQNEAASCADFDLGGQQGLVCSIFGNDPVGYGRMFSLASLGVTDASPTFTINSIDWTVNAGGNGANDVTINVFGSNEPVPSIATLDLIATVVDEPANNGCVNTELDIDVPTSFSHVFIVVESDASGFFGAVIGLSDSDDEIEPTYVDLTQCAGLGTDWIPLEDAVGGAFPWSLPLWVNYTQQSNVAPVEQDTTGDFTNMTSGDAFGIGEHTFRYTSDDGFGNVAECEFTLTVEEFPTPISELACNDHINLSLNENCEAVVTADLILEGGPYGCYDDYIVNVLDENDVNVGPVLDGSHVGQLLTVEVVDPETGNVCWGTLLVEDKIGPMVLCADLTIGCDEEIPEAIAPELDSALSVFEAGNGEEISNTLDPVVIEFNADFGRPGVTVADVNVAIDIEHTWIGDLTIELESPSGNSTTLWGGFCGPADNLFYIADDEGLETDLCVDYSTSGNRLQFPGLIPDPMFSEFDGEEANGTWTLTITDGVGGDDGTVQAVALELSVDADEVLPSDACGDVDVTFTDVVSDAGMCDGEFLSQIFRTWTVTDANGASESCVQTISIERPTLADLTVPPNFDDIDEPALECGDCTTPDCTGEPGGALCSNFQYTFKDHILPICAGSFTIVRKWKILDMCTSEILEHDQIIKVLDTDGPNLICPFNDDVNDPNDESSDDNVEVVQANVFDCEATLNVDLPVIQDDCGPTSAADFDIDLTGPAGVVITFQGAGFQISGMPLGFHEFTYTVTDECDNETSCSFFVEVVDKVPPTPVCDEFTEVSLTSDGTAKVYAETFDDGSHDNCSDEVWFKVIREDELCGTNHGFTGSFNQCLACDGLNANRVFNSAGEVIGFDDDPRPFRPGVQVYFDDHVKFCCDDVNEDFFVVLRVFDVDPGEGPVDPARMAEGGDLDCHFNDCLVDISVQDKLPPFISCPADLTFDCDTDLSQADLEATSGSIYGDPVVTDNCEFDLTVSISESIECGQGTVRRTFTATDQNGSSMCTQVISLVNGDPFNITDNVCPGESGWSSTDGVDWPCDVVIDDMCYDDIVADPSATDEPELFGDACSDLLVNFEDEVFTQDEDACLKILRTWKVLDWCQYDENTGAGIWSYTQVIKLANNVAPEFYEGCEDIVQCDSLPNEDCTSFVELVVNAADDCTDTAAIEYSWAIDAFYDPATPFESDIVGFGNDASGDYPFGTHLIRFTATDGCDNSNSCEFTFELSDCKKPSPKCFSGIVTVVMEVVGEVEIWASDFDAGSDDNCGDVTASFSEDVDDTNRTFTCEDVGEPVELPVWFTDEAGNQDFCTTFIVIQDNNGVCDGDSIAIGGTVETAVGSGVEGVEMTLTDMELNTTRTAITDLGGEFVFGFNPRGHDYTLEAYSNDDPMNGISTLDIVKIQKHLLGLEPFDSPYQSVAADVNNSESVSALDMVELRKLLLGVYDEFPNNTSWRFIDEDQNFADINNPWANGLDEVITINNLDVNQLNENFVGVKVGDLNNSATPNALVSVENRTPSSYLTFVAQDAEVVAGETYNVEVTAENFNAVLGYQFTMNFGSLEFAGFTPGALNVTEANFGLNRLNKGILTTSWNDSEAVSVSADEVLFTLSFVGTTSGQLSDMIQITSDITSQEAYSNVSLDLGVEMTFRSDVVEAVSNFELMQNTPNPFDNETVIGFNLPEDAEVTLTVQTTTGETVYTVNEEFGAGYNQFTVKRTDLNATGVVLYTVETDEFTATKKMILID